MEMTQEYYRKLSKLHEAKRNEISRLDPRSSDYWVKRDEIIELFALREQELTNKFLSAEKGD